jgi:hypothetical protein
VKPASRESAATTSVFGFFWAMLVLVGWATGPALLAIAVLKPIFPNNVGFIVGSPAGGGAQAEALKAGHALFSLSAQFPLPPGATVHGGYWVIPIALVLGLAVLVVTHRASRRILRWLRARRSPATLRFRVEVREA